MSENKSPGPLLGVLRGTQQDTKRPVKIGNSWLRPGDVTAIDGYVSGRSRVLLNDGREVTIDVPTSVLARAIGWDTDLS